MSSLQAIWGTLIATVSIILITLVLIGIVGFCLLFSWSIPFIIIAVIIYAELSNQYK